MTEKRCICLDCLYGSQPYCYFPIVCVHGKKAKDMYYEKFTCKHFERAPEPPKQIPWQVFINLRTCPSSHE